MTIHQTLFTGKKITLALAICTIILGVMLLFVQSRNSEIHRNAKEVRTLEEKKTASHTPLVSILPKRTPFWSISYQIHEDKQETSLLIFSRSPYHRYQAFRFLQSRDPEVTLKYRIVFVNYESPVGEKS